MNSTVKKVTKKVAKKAPVKKAAKKVAKVAKPVKNGATSKELVAAFLEGKSFANSRIACRQFRAEHKDVKIQQAYFYTLFATFGTRTKKKDSILLLIKGGKFANCMAAYKQYKTSGVPANEAPVAFTYFLNLWKKHFNLTGPIRAKATPKAKVVKKVIKKAPAKKKPVVKAKPVKKVEKKVSKPTTAKKESKVILAKVEKTLVTNKEVTPVAEVVSTPEIIVATVSTENA
jgi:hypothetical protein